MKVQENKLPFLVSGKFGDLVGRVVNGKQFFSIKRGPRKGKPTLRELEVQKNFSIAILFAKPLVPLLRKYDEPNGKKGFNKFKSHFLQNAIYGHHPDQRIDYSQVVLGEGSLPNPKTYHVESPAKGLLGLTWSLETLKRRLSKSDRIFVVVYCKIRHQFSFELNGAERRERQLQMNISCFSGQKVEIWFGFSSPSGSLISTSIYAGSITVL